MGVEDLSLDDIIKRSSNKKQSAPGMYSDRVQRPKLGFQRQRRQFARGKQQTKTTRNITDARLLLGNRSQVTDARQKITSKAPVVDARQKLQMKHGLKQGQTSGKIPTITIPNDIVRDSKSSSPITFHVTQRTRSWNIQRNISNSSTTVDRSSSGIMVAVKNDHVASQRQKLPPGGALTKKTFERLKITTINKDAIKKKPSPPARTPTPPQISRPIRKRAIPQDEEDSFDEMLKYAKQRKQAEEEMEIDDSVPYKAQKSNGNDLRPMISKHGNSRKEQSNQVDVEPGPSPIEGTKLQVYNLHPVVTEDDILELFSVLGAVRRAKMVKTGEAEVVYVQHDDAMTAYKKYNNRDLDGQPMHIKISATEKPRSHPVYSWMKEVKSLRKKSSPGEVTELNSGVLQQALFKGGTAGTSKTRPVVFTVKI